MAQVDKLELEHSFQEDVINQAAGRDSIDAKKLDQAFSAVAENQNLIIENLHKIVRDDGQLKDGSVGPIQISRDLLNLVKNFNLRGKYTPATYYELNDGVSYDGNLYICNKAHNSTAVFVSNNWLQFGAVVPDDIDSSVATAEAAAAAASLSSSSAVSAATSALGSKNSASTSASAAASAASTAVGAVSGIEESKNISISAQTRAENAAINSENAYNRSYFSSVSASSSASTARAIADEINNTRSTILQEVMTASTVEIFMTEVELLASRPASKKYAKANDTKKVWIWSGTAWVDSGLSDYDMSKVYTDDKNHNLSTAIQSSVNSISVEFLKQTPIFKGNLRYAGAADANRPKVLYVLPGVIASTIKLSTISLYSSIGSGTVDVKSFALSNGVFTATRNLASFSVYQIGLNVYDFTSSPIVLMPGEYLGFQTNGTTKGIITYTPSSESVTIKYYANVDNTNNQVPEGLQAKAGSMDIAFFEQSLLNAFKFSINSISGSVANIQKSINEISPTVQKIGKQTALTTGSAASVGQLVFDQPVNYDGRVSRVSTYANASGLIEVRTYKKDPASLLFTVVSKKTISVEAGLNEIELSLDVVKGDYIGILTSSVGLTCYTTNETKHGIYSSTNTGESEVLAGPNANFTWQFCFELKKSTASSQKWLGKKYVSFGDSITWYNGRSFAPKHLESGQVAVGYQSYVIAELGCTLDNKGESGWTMPEIYASRVNTYDFAGAYAVTLTSGANDHRKAVPVGAVAAIGAAFDTSTYTGAMQASVEKIIASNKDTKIFLITPIRGWYSESGTTNVPGPYKNEMMISIEYVNAIKQIGALYSIPVIDWYNEVGINDLNKSYFLGDNPAVFTAYLLHPNQKGFKKMGEMLASVLSKY